MTNVTWFLRLAKRRLGQAERAEEHETDPNFVKYNIQCAIGYLQGAEAALERDEIVDVCQYCGDESEEDHTCAMCVKG